MRIALATCLAWPDLLESDLVLRGALERCGHEVVAAPWNGPIEAFLQADVTVLRACWDYHENPGAFLDWLATLETQAVVSRNPPDMVRWNFDKSYLITLEQAGVRVPRTILVDPRDQGAIERALGQNGWDVGILKPVSGQSGFNVAKIDRARPDLWHGKAIAGDRALLQEFQADIGALGETTLVFFGGVFSHAARRVIAEGEWRANSQFGARVEPVSVSPEIIAQAEAALAVVPGVPVYARVDGLIRGDAFTVMEVELVEPSLYLHLAPGAGERFAEAIERSV